MHKKHINKVLGGLLSEMLSRRPKNLSKFNPNLLSELEVMNDQYIRFSHGVNKLLQATDSEMEGELDSPLAEYLIMLRRKGSEDVMTGPSHIAKFAELSLERMKDHNLLPPFQAHHRDQMTRITTELKTMMSEGMITKEGATRRIRDFGEQYYSLEEAIKLERIQLSAESLSASYADDPKAAQREYASIEARTKVLNRMGDALAKAMTSPKKVDLNEFLKYPYDGTTHYFGEEKRLSRIGEVKGAPWFERKLCTNLMNDCSLARSLMQFSKLGKPEFDAFPTDKVLRVLSGQSEVGFDRGDQKQLIHEIKRFTEQGFERPGADPDPSNKAFQHTQKMFGIVQRNFSLEEPPNNLEKSP